ncbi:transposase [Paraliobacillus ryukyuensis]|uniref:transposase n=1 Tax=Paraliobacillus ryukyuensis TaxID=200904 RepID=UPI003CD06E0E
MSLKDRKKVSFPIDMNAGYVTIIKALFPDAGVIIARFYLVQLISRAINKTRPKAV